MNTKVYFVLVSVVLIILIIALTVMLQIPNPNATVKKTAEAQKELQVLGSNDQASEVQITNPNQEITSTLIGDETMKLKKIKKPEISIDQNKLYSAVLQTTEGDITISFDVANTPITSNNFIYLSKSDFYDNTIFHRVINGFMIQGGDPQGDGTGGPGYKFNDEKFEGEYVRGTVAMANSGPNTNGSQFFIMHGDTPLSPNYIIFGKVIDGMDTVDKIATSEVRLSRSGEESEPVTPVVIQNIKIIEE